METQKISIEKQSQYDRNQYAREIKRQVMQLVEIVYDISNNSDVIADASILTGKDRVIVEIYPQGRKAYVDLLNLIGFVDKIPKYVMLDYLFKIEIGLNYVWSNDFPEDNLINVNYRIDNLQKLADVKKILLRYDRLNCTDEPSTYTREFEIVQNYREILYGLVDTNQFERIGITIDRILQTGWKRGWFRDDTYMLHQGHFFGVVSARKK